MGFKDYFSSDEDLGEYQKAEKIAFDLISKDNDTNKLMTDMWKIIRGILGIRQ